MANEATKFTINGVQHDVMDVGARQLIANVQAAINAITSGDTTTAIKTFQEVINFLDGVTDNETLAGKLNELRTLINGKYAKPANGIPSSDLAQSVQNTLSDVADKVDKETGKGLSTNDYTTEEKTKLAGLPTNPVQSISVNGTAQSKDTNGNVNIEVEGADGKSAYQSYYDTTSDNPKMTESEWAAAVLRSAYRSYLATTSDNPKMTEAQWVASLKGADGAAGPAGPQGNSGVASADGVIVVNNLTEGGTDVEVDGVTKVKVLSAEMGKELAQKMASLEEVDKVSVPKNLDDGFVSKLLNENEYTKTSGYYIDRNNGNPVASSGNAYIRIDSENFRGSKLFMTGINNSVGYALGLAAFNSEDTFISGTYYGAASSNRSYTLTIDSSTAYYLISIGKSTDQFKAVWDLDYIPTRYERSYDVVSVNGGKKVIASEISGLSLADETALKAGLYDKLNKIDLRRIVSGYTLYATSEILQLRQSESSSVLMQEIPEGVASVSVYGLKGEGYSYYGIAIVSGSGQKLAGAKKYGSSLAWMSLNVPDTEGKKYLTLNVVGQSTLPYNVDELIVLYDPVDLGRDSQWYIDHANDSNFKLNVAYESLTNNIMSDPNTVVSRSADTYTFIFPVNGEKYLFWYLPYGLTLNNAGTFIQYDSNDDVLLSENIYSIGNTTNFGRYNINKQTCAIVKLQTGCAKIQMKARFSVDDTGLWSMRRIIAEGNKVYLTNDRMVYWRKPRVTSIGGIVLNQYNKRPLEGLTICCLGDSITDFGNGNISGGYGYPKYIQSNFDCCCINYGRGNARFIDFASTNPTMDTNPGTPSSGTSGNENNKLSVQVRWMLRELGEENVTPDVVILSGGTNDCFSDVNYGTLADAMANYGSTTDAVKTTFYDAAVYMVSKIRAAFPNVKIFFGTPINSKNDTQSQRLVAWREAMINAANAMGCGVIDWYARSGIVPKPTSNNPFYNDDIHPSKLGVDMMAKLAVSEIAKAFPT